MRLVAMRFVLMPIEKEKGERLAARAVLALVNNYLLSRNYLSFGALANGKATSPSAAPILYLHIFF